jgi:hypothetical protein
VTQCAFFDARDEDGPAIARALHAELVSRGWSASVLDDTKRGWWKMSCRRNERTLVVAISYEDPGRWALGIAPAYRPGLIGELRGRPSSARPVDCYELALITHEVLRSDHRVRQLRWGGSEAGVVDDISDLPEPPVPPPPVARLLR